jgi:hypothetical protein
MLRAGRRRSGLAAFRVVASRRCRDPPLAVRLDQEACHRLGSLRRLLGALGRGDDRALHEDVPGAREVGGVAESRFVR